METKAMRVLSLLAIVVSSYAPIELTRVIQLYRAIFPQIPETLGYGRFEIFYIWLSYLAMIAIMFYWVVILRRR